MSKKKLEIEKLEETEKYLEKRIEQLEAELAHCEGERRKIRKRIENALSPTIAETHLFI